LEGLFTHFGLQVLLLGIAITIAPKAKKQVMSFILTDFLGGIALVAVDGRVDGDALDPFKLL
jgi:hypothetical protein